MPRIVVLLMLSSLYIAAGCERGDPPPAAPPPTAPVPEAPPAEPAPPEGDAAAAVQPTLAAAEVRTVEAACGVCIFGMEGRGCPLAVKIDGKPYFVTGADVNAHTAGLCAAASQAAVAGHIEDDRFVATSFELQP